MWGNPTATVARQIGWSITTRDSPWLGARWLSGTSLDYGRFYGVELSLLWPLLIFAAYPTITFARGPLRRRRRRKHGLCLTCGYNLTGNISKVCPECGTPTKARP